MEEPTQAVPDAPPPPRKHDRLAVAAANASLFNVGYLMMGRRRLAAATGLVTLVLIIVLTTAARSTWFEIVFLLWWLGLIGHGWHLARPHAAHGGYRVVALCVTLPVLATVGVLRVDAVAIDGTAAQARRDGDCAKALDALRGIWFGHRLTAAPLAARGDDTVRACRRLEKAAAELTTALTGDTTALKAGFDGLAAVLADVPGHERMVGATLDRFLKGLPTQDACVTARLTDWLRARKLSKDLLAPTTAVVDRTAPAALVKCGDALMSSDSWNSARSRYQQLERLYPGNALITEAKAGAKKATLAIELANVRELLKTDEGSQPEYCSSPAQYSGAKAYGDGTNRALFYGDDDYASQLPGKWRTTDPTEAVLVVCMDEPKYGPVQQSCPYSYDGGKRVTVKFHRIDIPLKAYELRTGKVVSDTKVRIGGGSCPAVIPYTTFGGVDTGPPTKDFVDPSDSNVRAAFESLITGD
ncbi:hypothetical protein BJF79_09150 [Actinomadura sp. CNU-125]|uniref:tetratricopeptide repeat protein n=1 Tax=Actinomadura sp. CNU-125 TaxID=1904961 RepID=UPI0009677CB7|nr:hypothetical protein [Actinomadura sp. CNU-125]OLT31148.1 hypothetical protein BJF79_09150 [Actinomadura sp. CNU-125]